MQCIDSTHSNRINHHIQVVSDSVSNMPCCATNLEFKRRAVRRRVVDMCLWVLGLYTSHPRTTAVSMCLGYVLLFVLWVVRKLYANGGDVPRTYMFQDDGIPFKITKYKSRLIYTYTHLRIHIRDSLYDLKPNSHNTTAVRCQTRLSNTPHSICG